MTFFHSTGLTWVISSGSNGKPGTALSRDISLACRYLRVSTARQDASSQRLAILEYAHRQGLRIDDFIEATGSARTNAKHRRLDQLMAVLEPGDQLVVSELSRLGRSLGEGRRPPRCDRQGIGGLRRR